MIRLPKFPGKVLQANEVDRVRVFQDGTYLLFVNLPCTGHTSHPLVKRARAFRRKDIK